MGLIPFLFPIFFMTFISSEYNYLLKVFVISYGAVILSFLGAVHWGYHIKEKISENEPYSKWFWSISPSIIAWFALINLFLNLIVYASLIISLGLVISLIVDYRVFKTVLWYKKLRIYLSFFSIFSVISIGFY